MLSVLIAAIVSIFWILVELPDPNIAYKIQYFLWVSIGFMGLMTTVSLVQLWKPHCDCNLHGRRQAFVYNLVMTTVVLIVLLATWSKS